MIESSTGLILRIRPLTDTSLIVQWLTRDLGRVATVAKGARRPKSTFAGKLDLFYRARFSFQRSRRSELHQLREVALESAPRALRWNIDALQQASYFAALVEQTTETETPVPGIYDLMAAGLEQISTGDSPLLVYAFELHLLQELGLRPDAEREKLKPDIEQIVHVMHSSDWTKISRLKLTARQIADVDRFLRGFMEFHLGRVPAMRARVVERREEH